MDLDNRVGVERKQFASQVSAITPDLFEQINAGFVGEQSTEFYEGLLAGYACSYQIMSLPEAGRFLGGIIAYLSEILEERT